MPHRLCTAQVPARGRCALHGRGWQHDDGDLERVLCCIDACAAHACCDQPHAGATQALPPLLLPDAALRALRTAQRALHTSRARLPPPALLSAVAGEIAARLGGVHDVALRRERLSVALVCVVLDLLFGVAAGVALLAHAAPAEAGLRRATALLLRDFPTRGCAYASSLRY